jgi:proline-specific peptidases, Bacillus coagulans-type subfamily
MVELAEQFIPFRGHRIWTGVAGSLAQSRGLPLLCLHGGPGVPHDQLAPITRLSEQGRAVIVYDQLGCGRSDHPHDPALWSVELFVEEVAAMRQALGLERIHLLGQSWGGMLALETVLRGASGIEGLVLADTPVSIPQWIGEADRLRSLLPPEVLEVLNRHEQAGTTDSPEYEQAMVTYYRRHVCRMDPWPPEMMSAFAALQQDPEVYNTLWGPNEFSCTGALRDWSVLERLGEITNPTLVLGGRFDEATPTITEATHRAITGSEWVIFEHSAHLPHLEEPERYLQVLQDFLCRHDPAS